MRKEWWAKAHPTEQMNVATALKTGLQKYASFKGRATVPEFWWLVIALVLVEAMIVAVFERSGWFQVGVVEVAGFKASLLFAATCAALTIPFLSVSWRRLHDIGWAGWWVLLWAVIVLFFSRILMTVAADIQQCLLDGGEKCYAEIGWGYGFSPAAATLVFVGGFAVLMSQPSKPTTNTYGPNPSEVPQ